MVFLTLLLSSCAPSPSDSATDSAPPTVAFNALDVGIDAGFQEEFTGSYQRGRSCLAADYDLDGRVDLFVGNPGDLSYLLLNRSSPGALSFELQEILFDGLIAFGGGPADYDNDGDADLFLAVGGPESEELDVLLENRWIDDGVETGALAFEDVSERAGIQGPYEDGQGPLPVQSANSRWGDYDRDGDLDLFINASIRGQDITGATCDPDVEGSYSGKNLLWRNNGDGTFTNVAMELGLATTLMSSYQSSWIDADNDGDLDLYENNYKNTNVLYINQLKETGEARFEPKTLDYGLDDEPMDVWGSFVSAVGDLNNDGWEDLIVLTREAAQDVSERGPRHLLFVNTGALGRLGFVEVSLETGLTNFTDTLGVMGSQLGDLNGDGILDLFIGNGGPTEGNHDQLFLSVGYDAIEVEGYGALRIPSYEDRSELIDVPAEVPEGFTGHVPTFPYRTHGTCIIDFDGDGQVEMAITNGGRITWSDELSQSPDRLFQFARSPAPSWLTVRPRGDGVGTPRDGTGTRVAVTAVDAEGETWTVHRTLLGGNAFSAHNGHQLTFGLADAVAIESVEIWWSDGERQILEDVAIDGTIDVQR